MVWLNGWVLVYKISVGSTPVGVITVCFLKGYCADYKTSYNSPILIHICSYPKPGIMYLVKFIYVELILVALSSF